MTVKDILNELPGIEKHPAFSSFVEEVKDVWYGREPLIQAWFFFRGGWRARANAPEPLHGGTTVTS